MCLLVSAHVCLVCASPHLSLSILPHDVETDSCVSFLELQSAIWKTKSADEQEEIVDNYLRTREELLSFWLDHSTWEPDDISSWILSGELPLRLVGTEEGEAATIFSFVLWVLQHVSTSYFSLNA